ncbi:SDR family oxidoreductase [Maribius pontilimi]|uniref:SDR family oxidoreductase n=1 Tax=Palleronia pontilimi TaxID=1964209 RepID=A0A934IG46_9RHOB|nr:SDR family oxidoreductase [Palleronia pontilimi]MBJ3762805.1 SDR family oxidoreductase [Palleronia pontilimi]
MPDLSGQHAIVTGGGSGIGLAIAQALAGAGAEVTITGRRKQALQDAADATPGLHPLVMDVTDEAAVVDGFAQAVAARGPIAICVANAGIAEGRSLHKMDLAFWRKILATNLDGVFLTLREALKTMRDVPAGRVIAISSIAGVRGLRGAPAYSASKHGVIGLIRGLSEDYMGGHITFNAICPGYVDTDIVTRNTAEISERTGMGEDEARQTMIRANRHKRLMEVSEIAAAALWLCDSASKSVNGQCIEISGGQT